MFKNPVADRDLEFTEQVAISSSKYFFDEVKVTPTYNVCLFARPAGKISKRSNFFVFGTLRNPRPSLEYAGETAFDGGGGDVQFCHFCHFWGIFNF
jgi:hypothetical protein